MSLRILVGAKPRLLSCFGGGSATHLPCLCTPLLTPSNSMKQQNKAQVIPQCGRLSTKRGASYELGGKQGTQIVTKARETAVMGLRAL